MKILIDGYNLIFQCGFQGRSAGSDALERARLRLLSELASKLDEATCAKTTVVFDAKNRPVKAVEDESFHHGIRVLFAATHGDADSLIEELVKQHFSPKQLTVVSSDHRVQLAAKRRKAQAIDSDVWLDSLDNPRTNDTNLVDEKKSLDNFNPFPPGYGEDIME